MKTKVALVGISGYGINYVNELLKPESLERAEITGAIDPFPEKCSRLDDLKSIGVPFFANLEEFYQEQTADLVIMSTPIQLHAPHTCLAMSKGSNVLCEKPLCATIQEAHTMLAAEKEYGKFAAIGYQWSFSDTIQALKKDVLAGKFGKAKRLKTLVFWPRNSAYYNRSGWAAKIKNDRGDYILDSPLNNATAHYLHNMLFVTGKTTSTSSIPATVEAELYRANKIENYDTAAVRCMTEDGIEINFYTTHAVPANIGPLACYEFENATVYYESGISNFVAKMNDGSVINYGSPDGFANKIWQSVDAIHSGEPVACSVQTAMSHTICMNGVQESSEITDFPEDLILADDNDGVTLTWANTLMPTFVQCYSSAILPSEHGGITWAKAGKKIDLTNYKQFPMGG